MEASDNQSATIDAKHQLNWLKAGCPYQMVATSAWKEIAQNIDRKGIMNASPEMRSMILVAVIIHNPNAGEICRMIFVANENKLVDNFEHYSKVLWLTHAQTSNPDVMIRITLALGIAPLEHIRALYKQEFDYCAPFRESDDLVYNGENHRNYKKAMDFVKICQAIIEQGARESVLKEALIPETKKSLDVAEIVNDFFTPIAANEYFSLS